MKPTILISVLISSILIITACKNADEQTNDPQVEQKQSTETIKAAPKTEQSFEIEYQKFTLDNGLEVIFHLDHSDPVVAVALTSHVGSARELPGKTGFAHLFEHLLFLESENLGKGGLDKMSARIGGSGANGSTSRDRTNYFQTVPNDALEKMIWAEADKLGFFINTVTEEVLAKEKQVVKNEKRQSYDNRPYGHTSYVIDKNLYPENHPYNWQVIGSLEDLQNATLQDVKNFFKRWYVPNNVTLVIAGDFDPAQAKQWVHHYFDEIKRGQTIEPLAKQPVSLTQTKKLVYQDNFAKVPELTMTWPTVPKYHADSYPLEVLKQLLSDGKKAPLNHQLIDQLKLTSNVGLFNEESELAGQMTLQVRAFDEVDLNQVEQGIQQAFAEFEKKGFEDSDLARIKASQETEFYSGLSSAIGKGFQLAQYNIFAQDPGFINQDVKNILAVTKADVLRVYHQYIKNKPYIATSFVPKGQQALALKNSENAQVVEEKIVVGAEQSFDPSKAATYVKTPSLFDRSKEPPYGKMPVIQVPKVWQDQLKNQLSLWGIENSEVPLVEFNISITGGLLFDDLNKVGVANLTAELLNRGTANKTPQELEEAIQQLGATINIFATRQSIEINASTLAKNYDATMALVTEMILSPRWDANEFELVKNRILSRLQQQQANPNDIAENQFNQLIYGKNHILSANQLGDKDSLSKINLEDLKGYYSNKMSPSLSSFHLVGDIQQEIVLSSLQALAENWKAKDISLPKLTRPAFPEKAKVYFYDVSDAKQSILRIGYPSLLASEADYYPAQVMNYILGGGGFASQLTQQLRETKGYTYGVRSTFDASQFEGQFIISSGVRANVTLEALNLINQIVTDYQTNYNEVDLTTTKGYFLKSNARRFETFNAKLNLLKDMSAYQLPADYVQNRAQLVDELNLDKIKQLANRYIQANKMIYLVVGDAKTQLPRLKELGLGEPILLNP